MDTEVGCQQADADAFCKLKFCDEDAFSTDYEVSMATYGTPGFACDGRGKNYGDWFGMKDVYFTKDTRKTHMQGKVVSNVTCK